MLATCNRGESATRAIRSLLALQGDFELVIVDQSEGERSPAFEHLLSSGCVRYHKMKRKGLSAARNAGTRLSRGELIAMTDDDCEAPANWLDELRRVFEGSDRVALVFGNVVAGPFEPALGVIPTYVRSRPFVGRSVSQKNGVEGIGACMGFRRTLWDRLGGFDEMLGAGHHFRAADEGDFALRALRGGFHVCETPEFQVVHHGFRTWDEGKRLARDYWYGTGAMFAKNLKLAPASTVRLLLALGIRFLFGRSSQAASSLGPVAARPVRLMAFARGFLSALVRPVNRAVGVFQASRGGSGSTHVNG